MNIIALFQDLVAQVPSLVQPLVVALAGAVPFVEGEGAALIGIVGGIHPLIAAPAAAIGNFVCVALLVYLGAGARDAIVARSRTRKLALAGGGVEEVEVVEPTPVVEEELSARKAQRKEKFQNALVRYGVPGVSLLGPLLLPTQFTATMLAATGIGRTRILAWQAVAIVLWTTLITLILTGAIHFVA